MLTRKIPIVLFALFFMVSDGAVRAQEPAAVPEPAVMVDPNATADPAETPESDASAVKKPSKRLPPGRTRVPRRRARLPAGLFGESHPESPPAADTVLGGTVPALWEIERSDPDWDDDNLPSLLERDSMAPPVPAKVIRYAEWLLSHYDTDADGALQKEEWQKMPGAPQAIDVDGDGRITLEELVRHLALYGQDRTIHRPVPVARYYQPKPTGDFQLFKPNSPPPPPPTTVAVAAATTEGTAENDEKPEITGPRSDDLSVDMTEEAMAADEEELDDDTYEELIAGRQVPAEKKYATPPELYKGLPAWFFFRDRDGDGQVSLVEFAPTLQPSALALFGRLDKNGDGFITPDELRTPAAEPAPTPVPTPAP